MQMRQRKEEEKKKEKESQSSEWNHLVADWHDEGVYSDLSVSDEGNGKRAHMNYDKPYMSES
jgi:hypothetical protein